MSSGKSEPKPPPDYFSRRVQFRLLMAVVSLLLVITLMFEARKAENWQWMWNGVRPPLQEAEEIDTSLPVPNESSAALGTVYAESGLDTAAVIQSAAQGEQDAALHRLELDVWSNVLGRFGRAERTALDQVLLQSRKRNAAGQTAPVDASWSETLNSIADSYQAYLKKTNEAVLLSGESLAEPQRAALINALRDMEVGWTQRMLPALRGPVDGRTWSSQDRDSLARIQSLLDELALASIQDDSFWRPAERDAWFRWFEVLQQRDPAQLRQESTGHVGFLQLFKQSDEYRGKLVTIQGTARLAYRVQAPKNIHGIESYVVYVVKPRGGPDSPMIVYALETPEGFPEVKDKDLTGTRTELNEEVAFTGFFFKRWAYPVRNGLQTAPLILARSPVWTAAPQTGRALPSWTFAVGSVAGVLLLSVVLATLVFRAGKKPVGEGTSIRRPDRDQLESLKGKALLASPEETLRMLAATEKENKL